MLIANNITRRYKTNTGVITVLKNLYLEIKKGERVAILGRNGAGKSTLIRLLGGLEKPDSGKIYSSMSISWPLGFSGGMQGSLTGQDNINFLCRVYGGDKKIITDFVAEFAELGSFMKEPVKTYSAGMRGRLNFALSMAFKFDCLLIDEGLSAGDSRFEERCKNSLMAHKDMSILMVSHSKETVKDFCEKAFVLENGSLKNFNSIDKAYDYYDSAYQHKLAK